MNFIQRKYGLWVGIWEESKSLSNPFSLWDCFRMYGYWEEFIPEFVGDIIFKLLEGVMYLVPNTYHRYLLNKWDDDPECYIWNKFLGGHTIQIHYYKDPQFGYWLPVHPTQTD